LFAGGEHRRVVMDEDFKMQLQRKPRAGHGKTGRTNAPRLQGQWKEQFRTESYEEVCIAAGEGCWA
jgi:hypothetical protein